MVERDPQKVKKYEEFLKRHMVINNTLNDQQISYERDEIINLCNDVLPLIKKDEMLAVMSPPIVVVGDIHGQYFDLLRLFSLFTKDSVHGIYNMKYVFLGDYVDRGSRSIECLSLILTLKFLFPTKYTLLRGNHETRSINRFYGFFDEISARFPVEADAVMIWTAFNEVFDWMPIAGLIGKKVLCMHGGLSPLLTSLDDIRQLPRPLVDPSYNPLALDILWADPAPNFKGFAQNVNRGISCIFGDDVIKKTCKRLKINLIVRAHQVMMGGYSFFAQKQLVTVFSAPRYQAEANRGAVMVINKDGKYTFKLLNPRDPPEPVAAIASAEPKTEVTQGKTTITCDASISKTTVTPTTSTPPTKNEK